jgi:hypothetical protein
MLAGERKKLQVHVCAATAALYSVCLMLSLFGIRIPRMQMHVNTCFHTAPDSLLDCEPWHVLLSCCRFFVYLGYLLLLHKMGIALFR